MQTAHTPQADKWGRWKLLGLLPLFLLAGCQSGAGTGALVGGGAGAAIGNLAAKATHGNRTAGTAIGGVLGAVTGAVVGDNIDRDKKKAQAEGEARAVARQNAERAPTVDDIISESNQGIPESVMINQIRRAGVVYQLSPVDIQRLHANGVPQTVINEMISSVPVPRVYQAVPAYERVTVVEPRPAVGVGVGFYGRESFLNCVSAHDRADTLALLDGPLRRL